MKENELKNNLFVAATAYLDEQRALLIEKVINYTENFYNENYNQLKVSFLKESIDVAIIVVRDIGLGFSAIVSVLLYRYFEYYENKRKEVLKQIPEIYSKQVNSILSGLVEVNELDNDKIFGILEKNYEQKETALSKRAKKFAVSLEDYLCEQGAYFKNFFISKGKDIRVILLKLAYHLYKIKNIKKFEKFKQITTCREARYLYAPLAHQLGLYNVKTKLEETAMKYLNWQDYKKIAQKLSETKKSREKYIENFISPLKTTLQKIGLKTEIKGRPKSIHSIWNKMKKQKIGIDKIFDLFAIRIVILNDFNDLEQEKGGCWKVYSKLTDIWQPNPNRLKDWISAPKSSGYESLHTTVIGPENKWVEVQIRTKRMDDIAEKGTAAHWRYKQIKGNHDHKQWLQTIEKVLENPALSDSNLQLNLIENKKNEKKFSNKKIEIPPVFAFTPAGELKKLKQNATILDFAYKLHSSLGDTCTGAIINNKHVGIKHKISNGDVIEVLTSKNQSPAIEWLDYVVSRQAKNRIKKALKKKKDRENIIEGKKILLDLFKNMKTKYKKIDFVVNDKKLNLLRNKFGYDRINNFYKDIKENKVDINAEFLYDFFIQAKENNYENVIKRLNEQITDAQQYSTKNKDLLLIDKNVSGIKYQFAKCCNPIAGDKIFAFVSATGGTKIHKINCPNARQLFSKYPYRVMPAIWKETENGQRFKVKIKIISEQKPGIVAKTSKIIENQPYVSLFDINMNKTENKTYEGVFGILVSNSKIVNELIGKLKQISGILSVLRTKHL